MNPDELPPSYEASVNYSSPPPAAPFQASAPPPYGSSEKESQAVSAESRPYPAQQAPPQMSGFASPPAPMSMSQPPAYHAYNQAAGPVQVVVNGQPTATTCTVNTVHSPLMFRENPTQTSCPQCHAQVVTAVEYETGTFTWLLCALICLVGCDLGCCFIPFCVDQCKDINHKCPNCQCVISQWSRMS